MKRLERIAKIYSIFMIEIFEIGMNEIKKGRCAPNPFEHGRKSIEILEKKIARQQKAKRKVKK